MSIQPHFRDFVVLHVLHIIAGLVMVARFPLIDIVVSDPLLEDVTGASNSYTIECYAFYSRAIGRDGKTQCTNYEWAGSCWNIIKAVNTQTCGFQYSYASTGKEFFTFSVQTEVFVAVIFMLLGAATVLIMSVLVFKHQWVVLLKMSLVLQFFAMIIACALCYSISSMLDTATYQDNNNVGQRVSIDVGAFSAITLPLLELMLFNTIPIVPPHKK